MTEPVEREQESATLHQTKMADFLLICHLALQESLVSTCMWRHLPRSHAGASCPHHPATQGLNERLGQQNATYWQHSSCAVGTDTVRGPAVRRSIRLKPSCRADL